MASALPQSHPDFEDVLENPETYFHGIHITPETHFVGEHASIGMVLANVPGTVGDVKARITWVQVPRDDGSVHLELVHRVGGYEESCSASYSPASVRSRNGAQLVRGNCLCCAPPPHHQCRRLGERLAHAHPWSRYTFLFKSRDCHSRHLRTDSEQLPPLAAFIPSGSYLPSFDSAHKAGFKTKPRLGKAIADRKKCHSKQEAEGSAVSVSWTWRLNTLLAFAPIPPKDKVPAVQPAAYLVFPWGTNDPEEAGKRREKATGIRGCSGASLSSNY